MARGRGKPTKLTPERQAKIVEAVKAGNYLEVAAALAGVSVSALHSWKSKGELQTSGAYHDFVEAINQAKSIAEASAVVAVRQQFGADWRAAAWFLEHGWTRPRWASALKIDLSRLEDHEIAEALALAAADPSSDGAGDTDPPADGGGAPA